ncbi:MAG: TPM domain-containing protein [Candidatus Solibacter sp.]|nr:TPM domain-containing protein [Candidatus Solibacter sp.]
MSFADDPCSAASLQAERLVGSLPANLIGDPLGAHFDVSPGGSTNSYVVSYFTGKGLRFDRTIQPPEYAYLTVKAHRLSGYPALYLVFAYERTYCPYLILPRAGKFIIAAVPGTIRDVDGDGQSEVVMDEPLPPWNDGCNAGRAGQRQWPVVGRFDPVTGATKDISTQFPDFYAEFAKDLRQVAGSLRADASAECRRGFAQMILKAESLSRRSPVPAVRPSLDKAPPQSAASITSPKQAELPQVELWAPWLGAAVISQGHRGKTSHFDHKTWENTYAIDVAVPSGTPVFSPADGVVHWVKNTTDGMGGRQMVIAHEIPSSSAVGCYSVFLHLSKIEKVSGRVRRGQVIAYSGGSSMGSETGIRSHLHFHLWSGTGSYDSHTRPIEKLLASPSGSERVIRFYNSAKGDLDDQRVAGATLVSDNFPGPSRELWGSLQGPEPLDLAAVLKTEDLQSLQVLTDRVWEKAKVAVQILLIQTSRPLSSLREYAAQYCNATGFGRRGRNNGLLIVYSVGEKSVAITAGPGLTPLIPQTAFDRIAEQNFMPQARAGWVGQGFHHAVLLAARAMTQAGLASRPLAPLARIPALGSQTPYYQTTKDPWVNSADVLAGTRANAQGYYENIPVPFTFSPKLIRMLPPSTSLDVLELFEAAGEGNSMWRVREPNGLTGFIPSMGTAPVIEPEGAVYFLHGVDEWVGDPSAPLQDARTYDEFSRKYPRTLSAGRVILNAGYCYWAVTSICSDAAVANNARNDPAKPCDGLEAKTRLAESRMQQVITQYPGTDEAFWAGRCLRDLRLGRATFRQHPMFRSPHP